MYNIKSEKKTMLKKYNDKFAPYLQVYTKSDELRDEERRDMVQWTL